MGERFTEGFKRLLPHRFKSTSRKAGPSTPTPDVYRQDVGIGLRQSEAPYIPTLRFYILISEAGSLCVPAYGPEDNVPVGKC